jgi:hypothetical protein
MKRHKKKKPADQVPAVRCTHSAMVDPWALLPNTENPNRHGPEQLQLYAKILLHQGWRKPIVVSRQSNHIVTGHGGWLAAKAQQWDQVPVDYQDFATPADEHAHMLADNRLPQLADLDEAQFAAVLAQEVEGKLDLELAGVLQEQPVEPELKPVEVKAPPKMAWVLIGIPLVRFSEINADIERMAGLPEVIVESTVNNGERQQ